MEEEKKNKRVVNRYFVAVLYPDDPDYKNYMEFIIKHYMEVTYITHDRDIDENGEKKKTHTHILFKVGENAHHLSAVAKQIGIPQNYLQGCNKDAMLAYLIHLYNPDKTRYNLNEVNGQLKEQLRKIIIKQIPEEDRYEKLVMAILSGEIKNTTQLMQYAIRYKLIEEIRKSQFLFCKMLEERKPKEEKNNNI